MNVPTNELIRRYEETRDPVILSEIVKRYTDHRAEEHIEALEEDIEISSARDEIEEAINKAYLENRDPHS